MMKTAAAALLLFSLFTSQALAIQVLSFPIARRPVAWEDIQSRDLDGRATVNEELQNNITQYQAKITVGNPPQPFILQIDTGSSDAYILDKTADQCNTPRIQAQNHGGCYGGLYNSGNSSTYKLISQGGFNIKYADGTGSSGDLISDDFSIGGQTIKSLEIGLAFKTTTGRGVMGIGYDTNEASASTKIYSNLIDELVNQGLINTKAYSLFLDDLEEATGSVLFGGIDTEKFVGTLQSVPVLQNRGVYRQFLVQVSSITYTDQNGGSAGLTSQSFSQPFLLDSGTTLSYVPSSMLQLVVDATNAVVGSNAIFINCDYRTTEPLSYFSFTFGTNGPTINVPLSEMILSLPGGSNVSGFPFKHVCVLAMLPGTSSYILGDSFLRSAYVVYDLTHNLIGLAQANFGSTNSNIVELKDSDNGIPSYTGAANGVTIIGSATATPTLSNVVGGTSTAAASSSGSASTTTDSSAPSSTAASTTAASTTAASTVTSLPGTVTVTASAATSKSASSEPVKGMEGAVVAILVLALAGAIILLGGSLLW